MSRPTGITFLSAVLTIAAKDLRVELRSRQLVGAMGLFALLATMAFYYTLESRPDARVAATPAVVWITIVFASTLGQGRSLAQEQDRGTLEALLLSPIDRAALFYGKLISTWLFSLVVAAIVSTALSFLFNLNLFAPSWWLVILLSTLGIAATGTLIGSMAIHARGRETLMPILILPIALPIIMASVSAASAILANLPFSDWGGWLLLLFSADVIFLGLALFLFDAIVEE
jgi:heme exporter protein B